jgi:hypothetical protein
MAIYLQLIWLFTLAIPIACISWTVTHEEVFKEPREYCIRSSKECGTLLQRKFFYLFTCEYCFSHYVTIAMLVITGFKLLLPDWRGFLISGFSLVWIANIYMSLYNLIKIDIKGERITAQLKEEKLKKHSDSGIITPE